MKITVLSGSPQGKHSSTLQYMRYLERKNPAVTFQVFQVGRRINRLLRDAGALRRVLDAVAASDAVLWAWPVYCGLVPAQLKAFIEAVNDGGHAAAFAGKPCVSFSTSVHFYDHTAHGYMHAVCEDLGMRVTEGYSAHYEDLMSQGGRRQVQLWFCCFLDGVAAGAPGERRHPPLGPTPAPYEPGRVEETPTDPGGPRVVLLTDADEDDPADRNLVRMTEVYCRRSPGPVEVLHLDRFGIRGGCLGCVRCAEDEQCVYTDGFARTFREKVLPADGVIYAGRMRDRFLSATWKRYMDRNFVFGHRPTLEGKQVGLIVSGPAATTPYLMHTLEGLKETVGSNGCGYVSDDMGDPASITAQLDDMARRVAANAAAGLVRPSTFMGVGGRMIFRDLVYRMEPLFRADAQHYRAAGMLRYPHQEARTRLNRAFFRLVAMTSPGRKYVFGNLPQLKAAALKKVVEREGNQDLKTEN